MDFLCNVMELSSRVLCPEMRCCITVFIAFRCHCPVPNPNEFGGA